MPTARTRCTPPTTALTRTLAHIHLRLRNRGPGDETRTLMCARNGRPCPPALRRVLEMAVPVPAPTPESMGPNTVSV